LYLAIGDGGTANDSGNGHIVSTGNAQSLSVIMGKMLRIDPNGNNSANGKYGIPASNPFVNTLGAVPEIYSYGLRNPYKFSFDPATGNLIEGDVGQNEVEEVNKIVSGGNFGWPIKEGTFLFNRTGSNIGTVNPVNSPGSPAGLTDPILEYDHNSGTAVVGGFIYHGALLPQLDGLLASGSRVSARMLTARSTCWPVPISDPRETPAWSSRSFPSQVPSCSWDSLRCSQFLSQMTCEVLPRGKLFELDALRRKQAHDGRCDDCGDEIRCVMASRIVPLSAHYSVTSG
jgi:hypothetical protein